MGISYNTRIPTDSLKILLDVSNPKCIDPTLAIDSNTRLKNIVNPSEEFRPSDTTTNGLAAMSFIKDGPLYTYKQENVTSHTGWVSDYVIPMKNEYTTIMWVNYVASDEVQNAQNLYGCGYSGRTSFRLADSNSDPFPGFLRFADDGLISISHGIPAYGPGDGDWWMFAATDRGNDGSRYVKFYLNGELMHSQNAIETFTSPIGDIDFRWCHWTSAYGAFAGSSNMVMYYERPLSDSEIMQIYNSTKGRFGK